MSLYDEISIIYRKYFKQSHMINLHLHLVKYQSYNDENLTHRSTFKLLNMAHCYEKKINKMTINTKWNTNKIYITNE